MTRGRSLRSWLTGLLGAAVTAALLLYLWQRRNELLAVLDAPLYQLLFVAGLMAVGHWLNALEFWVLYRRLGANISVTENWLLFTSGQLLNHLPGQVGTAYRFRYLKAVHDLGYGRSASGYGANLVLTILATGVLGLLGTLSYGLGQARVSILLLLAFLGLTVGALLALVLQLPKGSRQSLIGRAWGSFQEGWSDIMSHPRPALLVGGLEVLKHTVAAFRFQLAFSWIGVNEPWMFFLVLVSVSGLVTFLALTPASLGIREFMLGATASALGASFDVSLFGATIDRTVLLLVSITLGAVGLVWTLRQLGKATAQPASHRTV